MSGRERRAQSRGSLAFNALLEPDDDEGSSPPGHRNPSRKAGAKRAQQRRGKAATTAVPGFALRDAQRRGAGAGGGAAGAPTGADALAEMFPHADRVILAEVFAACGSSVAAAADALLAMDLGGGGGGVGVGSAPSGSDAQPGADQPSTPTLNPY